MASKKCEIDPQGDLIIKLSDPTKATSETGAQLIDKGKLGALQSSASVAAGLSCPSSISTLDAFLQHLAKLLTHNSSDKQAQQFKVSTKHLSLASARARRMFLLPFSESKKDAETGLREWNIEAAFDAKAFRIVLSIIHAQTKAVPRSATVQLLSDISAIVDDLQCRDAVDFFADLWITELWQVESAGTTINNMFDWILISSIFKDDEVFEYMTDTAIRTLEGPVGDSIPPIAPSIIGAIEQRREETLHHIHTALRTKLHEFCKMPGADEGTYMRLGALLHQLVSNGLYNFAERPGVVVSGESVSSMMKKIRGFSSPCIFKAVENTSEQGTQYSRQSGGYDHFGSPMSSRWGYEFSQGEMNLPSSLVQVDCSLATHMEAIVKEVESKMVGLELRDYVREESKLVN